MVQGFIEQFTYLGLFLVLFGAGLGLPVPEEAVVITGGVLAHQGVVRWWIALPVCLFGVLAGDTALYWIGHHWGEPLLEWRMVRRVLSRARAETLGAAYRTHGVKVVFTARHILGLRAAAFLAAGIARVPYARFIGADAAASLLGIPFSFGMAFLFTNQIARLLTDVHRVERWLTVLGVVAVVFWIAVIVRRRAK